ncbi:MAG: hypothetical protein ACK5FF_14790, partial [Planctomyces sp.]
RVHAETQGTLVERVAAALPAVDGAVRAGPEVVAVRTVSATTVDPWAESRRVPVRRRDSRKLSSVMPKLPNGCCRGGFRRVVVLLADVQGQVRRTFPAVLRITDSMTELGVLLFAHSQDRDAGPRGGCLCQSHIVWC